MSILIDRIINYNREEYDKILHNGRWYIAKPITSLKISDRIRDAFRVIIGKSFAVHYKEDE